MRFRLKAFIRLLYCVMIIAVTHLLSFAQSGHLIDSLQHELRLNPDNKKEIDLLNRLSKIYNFTHKIDTTILYANQALKLAEKINYTKGKADAYSNLGYANLKKDNYREVIKNLNLSLELNKKLKNEKEKLNAYLGLGQAYRRLDLLPKSLSYFYEGLKVAEAINDSAKIVWLKNNISSNLGVRRTTPREEALKEYKKSMDKYKAAGDQVNLQLAYQNMSLGYKGKDTEAESVRYGLLAIDLARKLGDPYRLSDALTSLAGVYYAVEKYEEAIDYYNQSLEVAIANGFKHMELTVLGNIGFCLLEQGKIQEVRPYFEKGLLLSEEINSPVEIHNHYGYLYLVDTALGDYQSALQNYQLHISYRDSVFNAEIDKKLMREEIRFESEKKAAEEKAAREQRNIKIISFAIITLAFLFFFYNRFKNQIQKRKLKKQVKEQTQEILNQKKQLEEMDQLKSRLYTNITHEFRTPLTLILGMSQQLESGLESFPPAVVKQKLSFVRRNGKSLLDLVNQMLDLSKVENNQLQIDYTQGDIVRYVRYITESFHSLANVRNVLLQVESKKAELIMDYDAEKIRQILSNLLSNAIKYTPSGGKVIVGINSLNSNLILTVDDTGEGVAPKDLPNIFDRFYQANDSIAKAGGTGIGLALTKELVKLLNGNIEVESEKEKGTSFKVTLPISNNAEEQSEEILMAETSAPAENRAIHPAFATADDAGKMPPNLLLIEDNPDVVEYLSSCLENTYQLDYAYNGRAGIEKALKSTPDLIISDVMMPEKDGFEVCETLKTDERTSHIPIILLTAKADVESRIAGLSRGADAYLKKPFYQEELLVILQNLLEGRKKLQARYARLMDETQGPTNTGETTETDSPDVEHVFLQKIRKLVEHDLSDASFGMPQLVRGLQMSRSQVYKKVKALTGRSPSQYVRSIRLHHSRTLLKNEALNISEVAYQVGFSSPVYFSDVFVEEFGFRPNETRK